MEALPILIFLIVLILLILVIKNNSAVNNKIDRLISEINLLKNKIQIISTCLINNKMIFVIEKLTIIKVLNQFLYFHVYR